MSINKQGIFSHNTFQEPYDYMTLNDGSKWLKLYEFDYDIAHTIWSFDQAKFCNTSGKYSILGSLNNMPTINNWYEFYYTEARDKSKFIRWKQSYNPLSRYTSSSSGTSSEYTFIDGTTSSSFYGLTRYTADDTNSCYLRGYPSWWGAIAPYQTSYDVFPGMWGTSTGNHYQALWIRIDNLEKTFITEDAVWSNNFYEY